MNIAITGYWHGKVVTKQPSNHKVNKNVCFFSYLMKVSHPWKVVIREIFVNQNVSTIDLNSIQSLQELTKQTYDTQCLH